MFLMFKPENYDGSYNTRQQSYFERQWRCRRDDVEQGGRKCATGAVGTLTCAADDAARKVKPAIDRVAEIAHQAVDKVAGVAAPTAAWLSEQRDSLKATQRTVAAVTGQYVSAHPWKSLGFALAAGFLISRFIR